MQRLCYGIIFRDKIRVRLPLSLRLFLLTELLNQLNNLIELLTDLNKKIILTRRQPGTGLFYHCSVPNLSGASMTSPPCRLGSKSAKRCSKVNRLLMIGIII